MFTKEEWKMFPYKGVILGFIVMIIGIVYLSFGISGIDETEIYKANDCWDYGFRVETKNNTNALYWNRTKEPSKIEINIDDICNDSVESSNSFSTRILAQDLIEWTGANPCEEEPIYPTTPDYSYNDSGGGIWNIGTEENPRYIDTTIDRLNMNVYNACIKDGGNWVFETNYCDINN